jgi:hypothetical protein
VERAARASRKVSLHNGARGLYTFFMTASLARSDALTKGNTDKGHPRAKASERKAADLNARTPVRARAHGRSGRRSDAEE